MLPPRRVRVHRGVVHRRLNLRLARRLMLLIVSRLLMLLLLCCCCCCAA